MLSTHYLSHCFTLAVGVAPPRSHCFTLAVGAAPPQSDQLAEKPALAAWASQIRKRDDESPTASPPGAHNLEQALMANFESAGDTRALLVVRRQLTSPCLSLYHSLALTVSLLCHSLLRFWCLQIRCLQSTRFGWDFLW